MPFITCLFSLIERSISAWHITSQIYIYIPPIMDCNGHASILTFMSFWQLDDHVTGSDSTPFTSLRVG